MLFWACTIVIAAYLMAERVRLRKILASIPVRIHVYGTRGKTTTTRYLVDAFRSGGKTVMGKLTGDKPLLLRADGEEENVRRFGPANVHEYIRCLDKAARSSCDTVVFECMALAPETIATATAILAPTHVVITNTRPDHHETMGQTPDEIAQTLASGIRGCQKVFAVEDAGVSHVREQALQEGSHFIGLVEENCPPAIQAKRMTTRVAAEFQIPIPADDDGEWPKFERYQIDGMGEFWFLDLFSANDVVSSDLLLKAALKALSEKDASFLSLPRIALLATRPDRPLRTKAFIDWFLKEPLFSLYALSGGHRFYALLSMRWRGTNNNIMPVPLLRRPELFLEQLRSKAEGQFLLVGLGNHHGYGDTFQTFLKEKATLCS